MAETNDLLQPPITTIPSPSPPPPPPPPPPPTSTSTAPTAPPPPSEIHPSGPPLAPKRQRRPSVRLGEIGHQAAATLSSSHDSQHSRRPKYKYSKASSSAAAAAKARSLTSIVNGNSNAVDYSHETLIPDQNGGERRAVKTKRPTKRAQSSWVSSAKAAEEGDSEDEGFREIDDRHPGESESPMKDNSLIQSLENGAALGFWNDGGGVGSGDGDGVRAWLIELGLSRYAPVFEIHEVDDEVLPLLTLEDLKDMGINAVGSRRKLYTAIQKLRKGFS